MIKRLSVLTLLLTSACSYPETQVRIPEDRPAIAIKNAPSDADLVVDGRTLGTIGQYFVGPQVLRLEPGTHVIKVVSAGKTLISEKLYLGGGGEIRTLTVPEGVQ